MLAFILSLIVSFLLILFFKTIALKFNLLISREKIPYTGGIGLSLGCISVYLLNIFIKGITLPQDFSLIILFSFIILLVELIDDIKEFSLRVRLIIQVLVIGLFIILGKKIEIYFLPSWLNWLFSFLWVMGITNAFNHLDIDDGVCGGVSLISSLIFWFIFTLQKNYNLSLFFATLSGALISFLFFNLPPAKVFMGNSGSHFLGFILGAVSIYGDYATLFNPLAITLPLFVLFFPVVDTFFLIVARLKRGINPMCKSNDHIFLRLLSWQKDKKKNLIRIYLVSLLWGITGITSLGGGNWVIFYFSFLITALFTLRIILKTHLARLNS
ncbi:MAG: undecaprenyl/decaprenyl-phosphate alpha-N-acetylglucosaminyl 1-phosphate transferase [Candidatus Omnitrophica bacterium]|nr:undecaprenyl/decaprenyl-phosphate alpha-N-acetylglucosaminyl 1-phosphate transferase [Candidatus Omnitrophota bacterium]